MSTFNQSMGSRVIVATHGTLGDLYPYIAIALCLEERGHQVTIATSEVHKNTVEAAGINFYPVRPELFFLANKTNQDKEIFRQFMDSKTGTKYFLCELMLPHLRNSYEDLMKVVDHADLLLTHPTAFAGPIVAEKTGIRWVSSVLAPISFYSAFDPPVLPMHFGEKLRTFSPLINIPLFWFGKLSFRSWNEPIWQLRTELGLSQKLNPLFEGQHSPNLVLALFSQLFGTLQPDWPTQTCVTGFAFYDRKSRDACIPSDLSQFLDAGPPPIVFTLGSAAVHVAGNFYLESAIAAKKMGCRAVLLTGEDKRNVPRSLLSENIKAFDYAPYSEVFFRASAIVHQGGVGTTAQALRAGRPMLIVPFSHEQPDNAARAERLGVSRILDRSTYTAECAAAELRHLLKEPRYSIRAAEIARKIQSENGVQVACDQIEAFLNVHR